MIIVYGADWCEDTSRSLRHLRRLGVAHRYSDACADILSGAFAVSRMRETRGNGHAAKAEPAQ